MAKNIKTVSAKKTIASVELTRGQKAAATKAAKRAAEIAAAEIEAKRIASLTPGQRAMETKRANGSDLSAIALKAVATRRANQEAKAQIAKLAEMAQAESDKATRLSAIAHKAVATRRANAEKRNGETTPATPANGNAALIATLTKLIATLA
jgi:hypothetical protein